MVEGSVGVEREPAKLFAKMLPVINHHTCTSYGINEECYGSGSYELGGTGQGNAVSGATCRNTSYLMFKKFENQNLGVTSKTKISNKEVIRSTIAFVDDTYFYTNGTDVIEKCKK